MLCSGALLVTRTSSASAATGPICRRTRRPSAVAVAWSVSGSRCRSRVRCAISGGTRARLLPKGFCATFRVGMFSSSGKRRFRRSAGPDRGLMICLSISSKHLVGIVGRGAVVLLL